MHISAPLFDSNYLSRGLALHESLARNVGRFHLYIFAFDDRSLAVLKQLNLEHTTLISLGEFENARLLAVKTHPQQRPNTAGRVRPAPSAT
jgi:hypothetical protein